MKNKNPMGLTPRERWACMLVEAHDRAIKTGRIKHDTTLTDFLQWPRQSDIDLFMDSYNSAAEKQFKYETGRSIPPRDPGPACALTLKRV